MCSCYIALRVDSVSHRDVLLGQNFTYMYINVKRNPARHKPRAHSFEGGDLTRIIKNSPSNLPCRLNETIWIKKNKSNVPSLLGPIFSALISSVAKRPDQSQRIKIYARYSFKCLKNLRNYKCYKIAQTGWNGDGKKRSNLSLKTWKANDYRVTKVLFGFKRTNKQTKKKDTCHARQNLASITRPGHVQTLYYGVSLQLGQSNETLQKWKMTSISSAPRKKSLAMHRQQMSVTGRENRTRTK